MRDHQFGGFRFGQGKTRCRFGAQEVLHRHRFARAHQGAVEHGVGALVALGVGAGGHVEAPGLDAALPLAPGKRHVGHAVVVGVPHADEVAVGAAVIVLAFVAVRCIGRQTIDGRAALGIGHGLSEQAAVTARHLHLGAFDDFALVERGHPGQRVLAAQLEVHRQIGDQRTGAHVHGALGAVLGRQQRGAQQGRGHLQHMKTRRERHAHHLEGARVARSGLRQGDAVHAGLAAQQGHHAALQVVLAFLLQRLGQGNARIAPGLLALHRVVAVVLHAAVPGNDVGVALRRQRVHWHARLLWHRARGLHLQASLDFAQRDGQQRRSVRPFGEPLDDAKGRGGKLGQRRHGARAHRQRKHRCIGQRSARGIDEILGQLQRVGGGFRKRCSKTQRTDQRVALDDFALVVPIQARLQDLVWPAQPKRRRKLPGHGSAERDRHWADRQARGLRVLALAAELRSEGIAHRVFKALVDLGDHAAGRGQALAHHQLQLAASGQAPVAGQRGDGERRLRGLFVKAQRLEQFAALRAVDKAHRNALAHTFHAAPGAGFDTCQSGGAAQLQDKKLVFVERLPSARSHVVDIRAATIECIASRALPLCARG